MGALLKVGKGILGLGRGKTNANYALTGYDYLKNNAAVNAAQGAGTGAINAQAGALGLNGQPAQDEAFNNFLNSMGYRTELDYGRRAIEGSAAARGKLNSGATLKSLTRFGQDLAQKGYGQYLGFLGGLSGQGLNAAQSVGAAGSSGGATAASTQPEKKGILGRFFGI